MSPRGGATTLQSVGKISEDWMVPETYLGMLQVAGIAVKGKSKNAGVYAEVQFKFCAPLKEPLSAEPNGDSARQQRWQESGEAGKALEAASKGIKCQ